MPTSKGSLGGAIIPRPTPSTPPNQYSGGAADWRTPSLGITLAWRTANNWATG
ncbi:hypothetical protein Pla175_19570 [Pirellulimonas nuda]|uniref:Uncharacterized protein n=1 Tax=Pirellulimonas nuda TaxID=2528009 RepID=A0A518DAT5_9BACT|nr:hypothetical protein [Pirellulimonas nuda]QDU88578.1 hypothetical protein Pla175_19570 [Pirellulimonas nuda]